MTSSSECNLQRWPFFSSSSSFALFGLVKGDLAAMWYNNNTRLLSLFLMFLLASADVRLRLTNDGAPMQIFRALEGLAGVAIMFVTMAIFCKWKPGIYVFVFSSFILFVSFTHKTSTVYVPHRILFAIADKIFLPYSDL